MGFYVKRISEGMGKDSIGRAREKDTRPASCRSLTLTHSQLKKRLTFRPRSAATEPGRLMADFDADPIWSSSRTARQIHDLGRVEKVGLSCYGPSAIA